ncbi:hypothetical protein Taro_046015 [Colocasia esculenta]|uniref:Pentatricopeptide repeat-containing protein n=1 Tax=Colocasia esculenta TaxID=4460 RepID=A0A843WR40_COLES|nr:hypothetical protein [Colocasia esculenta]
MIYSSKLKSTDFYKSCPMLLYEFRLRIAHPVRMRPCSTPSNCFSSSSPWLYLLLIFSVTCVRYVIIGARCRRGIAITDGVDVISISLFLGQGEPYELTAIATFDAMEKGIFVSTISRNFDPSPKSIERRQHDRPSLPQQDRPRLRHGFGGVQGFEAQVHGCVVRGGFEGNAYVRSSLVDMYGKCGGRGKEAFALFVQMRHCGVDADEFTYPSILNSLASMGSAADGRAIHCSIVKSGYGEAYVHIGNTLVGMYAKCGDLQCARKMFDQMLSRDVVTWTSLLTGCARHGLHEVGLQLFDEMRAASVESNYVLAVGILSLSVFRLLRTAGGQDLDAKTLLAARFGRQPPVGGHPLDANPSLAARP